MHQRRDKAAEDDYDHGSQQEMTVTSVDAVQNIYEELKYNKLK